MPFRCEFRSAEEWINSTGGCIRLNTSSDEAAKQYDATVTQILGYYRDDSLGGPAGSCKLMLSSDPNFILGRALDLEMKLMDGTSASRLSQRVSKSVVALNDLLKNAGDSSSDLEILHVKAVNHLAENELKQAAASLERLVTLYPEDVLALKLLQHTYIKLGVTLPMRNSLAYALARMSEANPLKGFAHGMYAFALEESNSFERAQEEARTALELNPNDTWAIHSIAHCFEMLGMPEEGLRWMEEQESNWMPCHTLASHQLWHKALFQMNNEQFDEAVHLLDTELIPRCNESACVQDWVSASSLLYRMELIDVVGKVRARSYGPERWSKIYDWCKQHERDHLWAFLDANYMMSYLAMDAFSTAEDFIHSLEEAENNEGIRVVKPILEAMLDFKLENYEQCAEKLVGIRHETIKIGGSHAQRDVFEQLLLVAANRSPNMEHKKLAERIVSERDAFSGGRRLPLTDHLSVA